MASKYQFKTPTNASSFETKNEFIEFCQSRYNDCHSSRRDFNYYFSFDYGGTWYPIKEFKHYRQIIQNEKKIEDLNPFSKKNINGSFNWIGFIIILFSIWTFLTIFNHRVKKIGVINNFNGFIFGWNSRFVRDGEVRISGDKAMDIDAQSNQNYHEDEFLRDVQITDYAIKTYENSDFLNAVEVTDEEKKWILGILSYPNPDPNGATGSICNLQDLRCEYCSNFIPSRVFSLQSLLKYKVESLEYNYLARMYHDQKETKDDDAQIQSQKKISEEEWKSMSPNERLNSIDWKGAMNDANKNVLNEQFIKIQNIISMYKQNFRHACLHEPIDDKFCSEKCSFEYRNSR